MGDMLKLQSIKNMVDSRLHIFAITKVFLCPKVSDMYPLGTSSRKPAIYQIPVNIPI